MTRNAFRAAILLALIVLVTAPTAAPAAQSVPDALERAERRGQATPEEARDWRRLYSRSRSAVRRLEGREEENLRGVIRSLEYLAGRRMLGARARPAFLVLKRNYDWFWRDRESAAGYGDRRQFDDSEVVYVFYPGSGWQIQPLITFVHMNELLAFKRTDERLRNLGEELLTLGVDRKGYRAYEYLFPFGGGKPGWASGMAQATGMQAFAGMSQRFGDARYAQAAREMLGAFRSGPPWGVRVDREGGGAHYLLYSHSPRLLVGNGFAQALIGLDAYADLAGDAEAAQLVAEGLTAARNWFPRYDTGSWSLYSRSPSDAGSESTLTYHRLFAGFLGQMCSRFSDDLFCRIGANFDRYEKEPVVLTRLSARTRGQALDLRFRVDKRASVTVRVLRGGRAVRSTTRTVFRGSERVRFGRPSPGGRYTLEIAATSPTGIASEASEAFSLKRLGRR